MSYTTRDVYVSADDQIKLGQTIMSGQEPKMKVKTKGKEHEKLTLSLTKGQAGKVDKAKHGTTIKLTKKQVDTAISSAQQTGSSLTMKGGLVFTIPLLIAGLSVLGSTIGATGAIASSKMSSDASHRASQIEEKKEARIEAERAKREIDDKVSATQKAIRDEVERLRKMQEQQKGNALKLSKGSALRLKKGSALRMSGGCCQCGKSLRL